MNGTPSHHHDLLERSVEALRNFDVPDGPPAALVGRTLGLLSAAAPPTPRVARLIPIGLLSRIAAAVLIATGALIGYLISIRSPPVAYADIARRIGQARTLQFRADMRIDNEPISFRTLFSAPGQMRLEHENGGVAMDLGSRRAVSIDHAQRHAFIIDFSQMDRTSEAAVQMIQQFRALAERQGEALGVQNVDGRQARGFRVLEKDHEIVVWADAKTGNLLRVEIPLRLPGAQSSLVLSDFSFNLPVDPALFDLVPPAGYSVGSVDLKSGRGSLDQAVAVLLNVYAQRTGGKFPDQLDSWAEYAGLAAAMGNSSQLHADEVDLMQAVGRVYASLLIRPRADWAYFGMGQKVGQGDQIIFWYRQRGTDRYRAVYGDLRTEELTADRLPTSSRN